MLSGLFVPALVIGAVGLLVLGVLWFVRAVWRALIRMARDVGNFWEETRVARVPRAALREPTEITNSSDAQSTLAGRLFAIGVGLIPFGLLLIIFLRAP